MKMETPKMDVVRFQEADVIVASGETRLWSSTIYNSGNVAQDMSVSITNGDDGSVNSFDYQTLYAGDHAHILANPTYIAGGVGIKLSDLIHNDEKDSANYINYNGYYESTDGNTYTWKHQ